MATQKITITIDEGVLEDAAEMAAQRGLSLSTWISQCTHNHTYREALVDAQAHRAQLRASDPSYGEWQTRLLAQQSERARRLADERTGA
ncbi:MAG TPA: hypothetical protein VKE25_15825 [Actinomycetes bacterium]|nr:hypothetical protein [Actinomycetes bacterium]